MAEKRQYRTKVILTQNLLPTHAAPGSVFVCKDTGDAWIATAPLGLLLNLHDLFVGNADGIVRAQGPQGVPGRDAAPSTVPGPQGFPGIGREGPQGIPGRNGTDGKDGVCICQTALDDMKTLRSEIVTICAEMSEHRKSTNWLRNRCESLHQAMEALWLNAQRWK